MTSHFILYSKAGKYSKHNYFVMLNLIGKILSVIPTNGNRCYKMKSANLAGTKTINSKYHWAGGCIVNFIKPVIQMYNAFYLSFEG